MDLSKLEQLIEVSRTIIFYLFVMKVRAQNFRPIKKDVHSIYVIKDTQNLPIEKSWRDICNTI